MSFFAFMYLRRLQAISFELASKFVDQIVFIQSIVIADGGWSMLVYTSSF